MESASPQRPPKPPRRRRGSPVLTTIGVLLLVLGLVCFGYVGWQLYGTNLASEEAYDTGRDQLRQQWRRPAEDGPDKGDKKDKRKAGKPVPGNAIALLSIPSIGLQEIPVLEGTTDEVLSRGIGHYPDTVVPGKVGNFAVAGHRITHGEPFAKLLEMNDGDKVIVETRDAVYTYVIDQPPKKLTVVDTEGWVLDPVPGEPEAEPTEELITLTTCQDLFHSPDRSVGFGYLVDTEKKN
jgi:sortase A